MLVLQDYFRQWGLLAIMGVVAVIIPASMMLGGSLLTRLGIRPSKPNPTKLDMYECGVETIGGRWTGFNVRYYTFALLFVVFDIEVIVLFPWALYFNQLGLFALLEGFAFIGILLFGYVYEWRKGGMEWT